MCQISSSLHNVPLHDSSHYIWFVQPVQNDTVLTGQQGVWTWHQTALHCSINKTRAVRVKGTERVIHAAGETHLTDCSGDK